ncbi:MAG TPA: hypothetical protein VJT71_16030 [Pyrinomonadaceae bacterium]|nr:hypothetical protein [Pyrinomonadaceae bacterium]
MSTNTRVELIIFRIAALVLAIAAIATQGEALLQKFAVRQTLAEDVKLVLTALNFIILAAFCVLFRQQPDLKFKKDSSRDEYWDLLNVELTDGSVEVDNRMVNRLERADFNNKRVKRLVHQLISNIHLYALFLMIVYLVFFIDNSQFYPEGQGLRHHWFPIVEDIFNYLSAVCLFWGFQVLHDTTIDKNDNKKDLPYRLPLIIISFIFLACYLIFVAYPMAQSALPEKVANWFRLVIGIFNGLAMALLFGKYISMEHSLQNIKEGNYGEIVRWGIIIILPIYALAQPLFGSFEITAFGDKKWFANGVFFVCLIGKFFFLYVTYLFLRNKLMHYYLHLVMARHGVPKYFYKCFESDSDETNEEAPAVVPAGN